MLHGFIYLYSATIISTLKIHVDSLGVILSRASQGDSFQVRLTISAYFLAVLLVSLITCPSKFGILQKYLISVHIP